MSDINKSTAPGGGSTGSTGSTGAPGTPGATGSGSDTVSAAKVAATPPQSATLASHTSQPLGAQPGASAAGSASAAGRGPEHGLHQDKSAGQGTSDLGKTAQAGAASVAQSAQSAADTVRRTASQVQDRASDLYEDATDWASEQFDRGSRQFSGATRRGGQGASDVQHGVERFINENPVLVGIVGLAAGLLVGALLPRTRREDRTFGAWADEVRDQGMRYARDMTHRGREVVENALSPDEETDHGQPGRSEPGRGPGQGSRPGPAGRYQNH